jgi:hypothetical protein
MRGGRRRRRGMREASPGAGGGGVYITSDYQKLARLPIPFANLKRQMEGTPSRSSPGPNLNRPDRVRPLLCGGGRCLPGLQLGNKGPGNRNTRGKPQVSVEPLEHAKELALNSGGLV